VETRQDMVDLKERQAGEAEQEAVAQREAIREEERRVAEQRQQAAQEREQITEERQQPDANQEALDQREQAAQQREQEAEQRQQELDQQREEVEQLERYADEKAGEAQQDRQGIAEDQQALINQEPRAAVPQGVLGAAILTPNASLGRLVKLNPDNGQEVLRSPLNTVNTRSIILINGRIIAIAGENRGNGAIRLVEIAADTLEMVKQGDDDIAPNSLLWANGNDLYAITNGGDNLYFTRFNADLVKQAGSSVAIHPFAAVAFSDGFLITQRADGTAVLLNPRDLTEKR
jgi:hypothetical protein